MKRYFDIYLRPAGTAFSQFTAQQNALDGWDRLEMPAEKAKLSTEAIKVACGDGTEYVDGEKLSFEAGTLRVSKAEYDYLKSTYNNALADILLYDPNKDDMLLVAFRLLVSVTLLVQSGESLVIKITGTRSYAIETAGTLLVGTNTPSCLVTGTVYRTDGVTPVANASVSLSVNSPAKMYADTTDKDGNYLINPTTQASPSTSVGTFTVTKAGGWVFQSGLTVTINQNGEFTKDILATTNGS